VETTTKNGELLPFLGQFKAILALLRPEFVLFSSKIYLKFELIWWK
jgi:hypothetical protein